jgi:hypothetical protein
VPLQTNFGDNLLAKPFKYDIKKCPGLGLEWLAKKRGFKMYYFEFLHNNIRYLFDSLLCAGWILKMLKQIIEFSMN